MLKIHSGYFLTQPHNIITILVNCCSHIIPCSNNASCGLFRNFGSHQQDHTTSQHWGPQLTSLPPPEQRISEEEAMFNKICDIIRQHCLPKQSFNTNLSKSFSYAVNYIHSNLLLSHESNFGITGWFFAILLYFLAVGDTGSVEVRQSTLEWHVC
jgi:hypothetical protein